MTDTTPTGTPREDWTLDQLGEFARQVAKRSAHDAWNLGRAYTIAKAKAKAEGQKIGAWRRQWIPFVSQPTLSRYEAVGRLAEEDVLGKGIAEVYRLLELLPAKDDSPATANGEAVTPLTETATEGPPVPPAAPSDRPPEPDSLLLRVAKVATLVRSLVNDLADLDPKAEEAEALGEDLIPLTVTSPPYNDLRKYGGHSWDFGAVAAQLARVTRPGGVVCWVVQDGFKDGFRTLTSFRQAIRFVEETGLSLWETLIAEMVNFSRPNPRRYYATHHYCFVLSKGRPRTVNRQQDRKNKLAGLMRRDVHRRGRDGIVRRGDHPKPIAPFGVRTTVWRYPAGGRTTSRDREAFLHPALMHEELARDLILTFSNPYDVVLDPFAGAGTTAKMAMLEGRRWLGFEVNEEYVAIARERLKKTERQLWASLE